MLGNFDCYFGIDSCYFGIDSAAVILRFWAKVSVGLRTKRTKKSKFFKIAIAALLAMLVSVQMPSVLFT
jgi:hypothetical protein